jgi:hypothetical protein
MNYPSIGMYNQTFQKKGGVVFNKLNGINLIPSRTKPISVYLFGSGAYAAVFKGSLKGYTYAIRCFLTAETETLNRYKSVSDSLKKINSSWKTDFEFIDNEISVNGKTYPIIKMEWINGLLINEFVSKHLNDNNILSMLQRKLIEISIDLERNKIGHGDIQCGNILICGTGTDFKIKLIDYDGMYVPDLAFKNALEKGRSEFQHPRRTLKNYNHEMDRFSFWVIITALEALKFDKSLWNTVMDGGFNTLDNFLFTISDFLYPDRSILFNRLRKLNQKSLIHYIDNLKNICNTDYTGIPAPNLYNGNSNLNATTTVSNNVANSNLDKKMYKIVTSNCSASVLTSTLKFLGSTPLELDKKTYVGKMIIVSNGKETKHVFLDPIDNLIEIRFN